MKKSDAECCVVRLESDTIKKKKKNNRPDVNPEFKKAQNRVIKKITPPNEIHNRKILARTTLKLFELIKRSLQPCLDHFYGVRLNTNLTRTREQVQCK